MTYDTNKACFCRPPTAEEAEWYRSQGIDPKGILISYADSHQQSPQGPPATPATPTDLKNAFIWMDNFMGTTNATIAADVISMKAQSLTFFVFGHNYDYSGNYTVMINKPREHKKPLFGFGSPETASLVMLEDFGGDAMPLTNVIIWEKSKDFLDVVAIGKEWIYSGPYTLQKP